MILFVRFSETSPYQTNEFNEGGHRLFPIRRQNDQKPLSPKEYVAIIGDVLRMKKNICLCRHFHRMDKMLVQRSNHIKYIDVSFQTPFSHLSLYFRAKKKNI